MALLVFGIAAVVGITVGMITIPVHDKERMDRYTEGLGKLCPILFAVGYGIQYRRRRKWDDANASATPRTDATGETILAESPSRQVGSTAGLLNGRIILTPRRIVFFAGTVRELDLELASITSTARTRWRASGKVLDLTLADGTVHRLIVDRFDAFAAQLGPVLARARAA
jgi:hypothetical protein